MLETMQEIAVVTLYPIFSKSQYYNEATNGKQTQWFGWQRGLRNPGEAFMGFLLQMVIHHEQNVFSDSFFCSFLHNGLLLVRARKSKSYAPKAK